MQLLISEVDGTELVDNLDNVPYQLLVTKVKFDQCIDELQDNRYSKLNLVEAKKELDRCIDELENSEQVNNLLEVKKELILCVQ